MQPLNKKEVINSRRNFFFLFLSITLLLFSCTAFTIITANKGLSILESRHTQYQNVFENQAKYNHALDEIIKELNILRSEERDLNEYRKYQSIITDKVKRIEEFITKDSIAHNNTNYKVFEEILAVIGNSQEMLDKEKNYAEEYEILAKSLEKCKKKYIENIK